MLTSVWGINIAVKDLDKAVERYEKLLGVKPMITSDPKNAAFPGITAASFAFRGFTINLMTSSDSNNPVGRFLEKKGEGILLVSIESDDIDADVEGLKSKEVPFFFQENVSGGYGKVNFIPASTMNGVQWEILQPPQEWKDRRNG